MSIITFFKNVWNAQRNADALDISDTVGVIQRSQIDDLRAENAALRSQISQRDASGKFTKKNAS